MPSVARAAFHNQLAIRAGPTKELGKPPSAAYPTPVGPWFLHWAPAAEPRIAGPAMAVSYRACGGTTAGDEILGMPKCVHPANPVARPLLHPGRALGHTTPAPASATQRGTSAFRTPSRAVSLHTCNSPAAATPQCGAGVRVVSRQHPRRPPHWPLRPAASWLEPRPCGPRPPSAAGGDAAAGCHLRFVCAGGTRSEVSPLRPPHSPMPGVVPPWRRADARAVVHGGAKTGLERRAAGAGAGAVRPTRRYVRQRAPSHPATRAAVRL